MEKTTPAYKISPFFGKPFGGSLGGPFGGPLGGAPRLSMDRRGGRVLGQVAGVTRCAGREPSLEVISVDTSASRRDVCVAICAAQSGPHIIPRAVALVRTAAVRLGNVGHTANKTTFNFARCDNLPFVLNLLPPVERRAAN